ncbi:MAG: hypothetical protein ACYSW8_23910 [Planctomycetota bacterium]|jgi:hypothetical protein
MTKATAKKRNAAKPKPPAVPAGVKEAIDKAVAETTSPNPLQVRKNNLIRDRFQMKENLEGARVQAAQLEKNLLANLGAIQLLDEMIAEEITKDAKEKA